MHYFILPSNFSHVKLVLSLYAKFSRLYFPVNFSHIEIFHFIFFPCKKILISFSVIQIYLNKNFHTSLFTAFLPYKFSLYKLLTQKCHSTSPGSRTSNFYRMPPTPFNSFFSKNNPLSSTTKIFHLTSFLLPFKSNFHKSLSSKSN